MRTSHIRPFVRGGDGGPLSDIRGSLLQLDPDSFIQTYDHASMWQDEERQVPAGWGDPVRVTSLGGSHYLTSTNDSFRLVKGRMPKGGAYQRFAYAAGQTPGASLPYSISTEPAPEGSDTVYLLESTGSFQFFNFNENQHGFQPGQVAEHSVYVWSADGSSFDIDVTIQEQSQGAVNARRTINGTPTRYAVSHTVVNGSNYKVGVRSRAAGQNFYFASPMLVLQGDPVTYQSRMSFWDITEEGQKDCVYLKGDGVGQDADVPFVNTSPYLYAANAVVRSEGNAGRVLSIGVEGIADNTSDAYFAADILATTLHRANRNSNLVDDPIPSVGEGYVSQMWSTGTEVSRRLGVQETKTTPTTLMGNFNTEIMRVASNVVDADFSDVFHFGLSGVRAIPGNELKDEVYAAMEANLPSGPPAFVAASQTEVVWVQSTQDPDDTEASSPEPSQMSAYKPVAYFGSNGPDIMTLLLTDDGEPFKYGDMINLREVPSPDDDDPDPPGPWSTLYWNETEMIYEGSFPGIQDALLALRGKRSTLEFYWENEPSEDPA